MKVSIFGLGYVGCVTAACLAKQGNRVVGVDVVADKVDAVRAGRWPLYEPGLDDLGVFQKGLVTATTDIHKALAETEISLVCVGTPSLPDGRVDTTYLKQTIAGIAKILRTKKKPHVLLVRSTVPPGTNEKLIFPLLSPKQRKLTAFYPEFLREGTAIKDFFNPSLNVIGALPGFPAEVVNRLMPEVKGALDVVSVSTAESIKYANNSFHGLKIAFTNEFARFCRAYGADADKVMELFCKDTKLNLSPYYMRPGFAFGGSCLPKELRALAALSKARGLDATLFDAISRSNDALIQALIALLYSLKPRTVGWVGVTFKPNTDDLRESPVMRAIELLEAPGRSYSRRIAQVAWDNPKALERLHASGHSHLEVAGSLAELAKLSDIVVLGPYKLESKDESLLVRSGRQIIDLKWFRVGAKLRAAKKYHSLV